jgi:drug/metabolite transporter (DMT)-like permease
MPPYFYALAASVLFALNGTVVTLLLRQQVGVGGILAGRFWIAFVALTVVCLVKGRSPLHVPGGLQLVVPFSVSVIASHLVFVLALSLMQVATAIVLVYTAPALLVLYESVSRRSLPSLSLIAAAGLAIAGVVLVLRPTADEPLSPSWLVLAMALPLSYAAYMAVASRVPATIESTSLLWWTWCAAAVISSPLALTQHEAITGTTLLALLYLGILGTLTGFLLVVAAVRRASPARIGVIAVAEVPLAAFSASIFLGQSMTLGQALGATIVAGAVVIIYVFRPRIDGPSQGHASSPAGTADLADERT